MHPLIQLLLGGTVLVAAVYDLKFRRIPNSLTIPALAGGLALNAFLGGLHGLLWAAAGLALGGTAYLALYWLRAMGAGDVKLMAAAGSIIGPQHWVTLFIWSALAGGVVAIVTILRGGLARRSGRNVVRILGELLRLRAPHRADPSLDIRHESSATTPHGVAIAIGAFLLLATS